MRSSRRRPEAPPPASSRPAADGVRRGDGRRSASSPSVPQRRRERREIDAALDEAHDMLASGAADDALAEGARVRQERAALRGKARKVADSVSGAWEGGEDGGDERLRAVFERREREIRAPAEAFEGEEGGCEKCEGKGYLWICSVCDAVGFVRTSAAAGAGGESGAEVAWRTCEKCVGVGKMPCDVCQAPVFSDTITPVKK